MGICSFCESIAFENSSEIQKSKKELGIETAYAIRYVRISVKDGRERGTVTSGRYPLKFCPECGRKIVFDES